MSAGMPELGSKISLISKADIRYEGRLFTVDPQECTIALANVRSFGTEERETQFPVAPQNQVYEYILFRGSDIKDIRVVNSVNNIPNDPAIVQMTVQPSMGQPSYQPQPGYGHPMMGQMGPMGGQYGAPYGMAIGAMGPVMGMPGGARDPRGPMNKPPSELSSGLVGEPNVVTIPNTLPTANVKPLTKDQSLEDGVLDLISGGSRSTTPTSSLLTRKSPTMDQGIQVGHQAQQHQQQQQQHHHQQPQQAQVQQQQQQIHQSNNIISKFGDQPPNRAVQPPRRGRESPGTGRRGMGQYTERKHEAMKQDGQLHDQGHNQGIHGAAGRGQRGGWIARGGNMRGRGRGRGVFRNNQPGNAAAKPKNTLKFDNDYDFEQANTEFEELRSRLAKAKIDAGTENEKKDDSGNETGAGEGEPEEDQDVVHYDKSKSFFDNISCEAVERSKGRSQRTDWRKERKLNSETFGVASTRRGGFRGHGCYYNRGMGGMYRGGGGGGGGNVGPMGMGPQGMMGGGGGGGYRGGYRGQRGGNRKPHGANQQVQPSQNRANNEQSTSVSQQQQQQNAGVRLVTGTA